MANWMREAEKIWKEKRGRKAKRQTVYQWLDYQGKLTAQNLKQRHLVLYNAAGSNLSGARIDRESLSAPFVVEHKLYWTHCETAAEADYLAAVLNSEVVNEAIKPFQSTGLMGERDIEKKVLDWPIPLFRADNSIGPWRILEQEPGPRLRTSSPMQSYPGPLPGAERWSERRWPEPWRRSTPRFER